jgi:protein phosphatase PTC2/3
MKSHPRTNFWLLLVMVKALYNTLRSFCLLPPSTGIWDCLTSQQVCDFVRRGVKDGKELSEIGEAMCDHCLAPDTNSGAGIGCDNMTVLIVALLQGRTKEEWYTWISDRVDKNYGYETPEKPPRLYAEARIQALRNREEARAQRERMRSEDGDTGSLYASNIGFLSNSALSGFARVLGSTGGISFHPGSGFISDTGNLMFGSTDDSDDSGDDEMDMTGNLEGIGSSFFTNSLRFDSTEDEELDSNSRLRAQLAEFEKDDVEDEHLEHNGLNSHMISGSAEDLDFLQGEAPPPPPAEQGKPGSPVKQLKNEPSSESPSDAVIAEGLMDSSEDPTKI